MRIVMQTVVLIGLLAACQPLEAQVNERENAIRERQEVADYAEAVSHLSVQREAFLLAVQATNQSKSADEVVATVTQKTLGALMKYGAALRAIDIDSEVLRRIHAIMGDGIDGLIEAHKQFASGLSSGNYVERRKALELAYMQFHTQQADYQAQLGDYFKSLGLKLRLTKQLPSTN